MSRTKESCPHCHAGMYLFHRQYVCLECGEHEPERRWVIPSLDEEISETMEILGALYRHHFHKVKSSHSMSHRSIPPGASEVRRGYHERLKERIDEHGEFTAKLHFVGGVMENILSRLSFSKRQGERLAETEEALALNEAYAQRWFGEGNV